MISAMRELGLHDEDTTAAYWAAYPEVPPTWDDIGRSYRRAVRSLTPDDRARYSAPRTNPTHHP